MMPATKQVPAVAKRKPPAAGMGRRKGSLNKTTALLKDAILQAATNAGGKDGLVGYLEQQAKDNPGPFLSLVGKVLPLQLSGGLTVDFVTKEQRDAAIKAASRANG